MSVVNWYCRAEKNSTITNTVFSAHVNNCTLKLFLYVILWDDFCQSQKQVQKDSERTFRTKGGFLQMNGTYYTITEGMFFNIMFLNYNSKLFTENLQLISMN